MLNLMVVLEIVDCFNVDVKVCPCASCRGPGAGPKTVGWRYRKPGSLIAFRV